jgi:hypothetical protein
MGDPTNKQYHKEGAVRHAEKRRISTCVFADRIARASIDTFLAKVPQDWTHENKQICLASFVAHFNDRNDDDNLKVLAFGVGTKFLSEEELKSEIESSLSVDAVNSYGKRIRDSHAEVLAKRAFRRQLICEMEYHLGIGNSECLQQGLCSILKMNQTLDGMFSFALKDNVTIHMYTSSAPCGNATLKKFSKMTKETFQPLGANDYAMPPHDPIPSHSLHLGQCSLLVKKKNDAPNTCKIDTSRLHKKQRTWPANVSDEWCPPGTSLPHMSKGSIHTCSDKIARWNCIGLQGSLLSSLIKEPIYMASLTVGRKFTRCIAQRAVCCRACGFKVNKDVEYENCRYKVHHPSIICTAVYLDESGVIDMSGSKSLGQDVRFHSNLCWSWWSSGEPCECLDGDSGYLCSYENRTSDANINECSKTSTLSLTKAFLAIRNAAGHNPESCPTSLFSLRSLKEKISPVYESNKLELLNHHKTFSTWNRRSYFKVDHKI